MLKLLFIFIFTINFINSFGIQISPTGVYLDLSKAATKEFTIINPAKTPLRVEVIVEKPKELPEEYFIGDTIKFYPKIISIPPLQKKVVRFSAKPQENLKDGEYKADIRFKELSEAIVANSDAKFSVDVRVNKDIVVSAYGLKGERIATSEFKNMSVEKTENNVLRIKTEIVPTGNSSLVLKFIAKYYDGSGKELRKEDGYLGRADRGVTEPVMSNLRDIPAGAKKVKITVIEGAGDQITEKEFSI